MTTLGVRKKTVLDGGPAQKNLKIFFLGERELSKKSENGTWGIFFVTRSSWSELWLVLIQPLFSTKLFCSDSLFLNANVFLSINSYKKE